MMFAGYEIDLEIFRRYAGQSLPRHVAYPMPTWWEDFDEAAVASLLRESRSGVAPNDLSVYLHVPFCENVCRYCACNRVALPRSAAQAEPRTEGYVAAVVAEIERMAQMLGDRPTVRQVHWGGGTPTYLSCQRLRRIHGALREHFILADDAEIAIELDPRTTTRETLAALRELGFTRVSLGVQDFNAQVQAHVRREQPYELVRDVVAACRDLGFESINFDLIYGLPYQTPASIRETLRQAITLAPDRVAYYQFAQIPEKIAAQRGLNYAELPDSETKLLMYLIGHDRFIDAGYEFIGLDHFAKPDEPLAVARRNGTLQRNFQGMTTGGGLDLIGLGASSISHLGGVGFLQNVRQLHEYTARIDAGGTAIFRGKRFSEDDRIRQAVLGQLYCDGCIRPDEIAASYAIDFGAYFEREMQVMRELEIDGLVRLEGNIELTMPLGRVLMRTVAAVFDAYLSPDAYRIGDRQYFSANA